MENTVMAEIHLISYATKDTKEDTSDVAIFTITNKLCHKKHFHLFPEIPTGFGFGFGLRERSQKPWLMVDW